MRWNGNRNVPWSLSWLQILGGIRDGHSDSLGFRVEFVTALRATVQSACNFGWLPRRHDSSVFKWPVYANVVEQSSTF
jgi:hypothetical protein